MFIWSSVDANALPLSSIRHNGTTGTQGAFPLEGTGQVSVVLSDLSVDQGFETYCQGKGLEACLGKVWRPGSQGGSHTSSILQDDTEFDLIEVVVNDTDAAWSGYHIDISAGADFTLQEATLVALGPGGEIGDPILGGFSLPENLNGFSAAEEFNRLWFSFDQPIEPISSGGTVGLVFVLDLENTSQGVPIFLNQMPSLVAPEPGTIVLIGLGLLGIWGHKRRKAPGPNTDALTF